MPWFAFAKTYRCVSMITVAVLVLMAGAFDRDVGAPGRSFPAVAHADSGKAPAQWPHLSSDLAPDPSVVFGMLDNGFRYVLMPNDQPKDRVSLHLDVMAGSMQETEAQSGLAHFLEHMLFNGSAHFPPGELVKYFQSIGMQFGADANAHTGFFETVYDILLPDGRRESLEKGLLILEDYASGALLLAEELEREKRVILAEKRDRDSAGYRTFVSTLSFSFPDARISKRLPIGSEQVIRETDRERMVDYYDTWYRPENMVLVMVGDFEVGEARGPIEDRFSRLTARATPRPDPDFGHIDHKGTQVFYHDEKEAGKTSVSIEVVEKVDAQPDSAALQRRLVTANIADRIVQNRLDDLTRRPDAKITDANVGSGLFLRQVQYGSIGADCKPEYWAEALTLVERTLRQALIHGFSHSEVERVRQDVLAEMSNAVKEASTRDSQELARSLIRHINADRVFMSPAQEEDLLAPFIRSLTPEAVHQRFKEIWSADHRLVLVTGNVDLSGLESPPEQAILAVFGDSRGQPVTPVPGNAAISFPYLAAPEAAGGIEKRLEVPDLGVVQVDFDNGVRLNLKPTDFKSNEVVAVATFGNGSSSEPEGKSGLVELAVDVVNESGLGRLTRDELNRALAGKSTETAFAAAEDRFSINGRSVTAEIPLLFQLLHAQLEDPGFRQQAFDLVMARFRQQYEEMARTTDGAMALVGRRFFAGGDRRFGLPPYPEFSRMTLDDVRSWLAPVFENAALEVSVVGDFSVDAVIELAGKYLGGLSRSLASGPAEDRPSPVFPRSRVLADRVKTEIPKGLVVVGYPTEDMWDIGRTRRLSVLGQVFSDQLRERIRERLGAAYSPFAFNRPSRAYRGYGVLQAFVQTAPEETDAVVEEIKAIADELAKNGVPPDVAERALEPTLTGIKDMLRTNGYWLNTVLAGSRRHPEQLDWARSIAEDYAAITPRELSSMAGAYLKNPVSAVFVAVPAAQGP